MKNLKKKIHILLVMAVMALAMLTPAQAAGAKLNKTKLTIEVGKKATLKVKNSKKKVKWSSSKKKVASVNQKGVVTGKKAGKATITAKVGGKNLKCKVTVKKASVTKPASDTTKPDSSSTTDKDSTSTSKKNEWIVDGNPANLSFWNSAVQVNQQHMYFVYGRIVYLTYDAKGNLAAKIALKNQTMGSSYQLKEMYCKISSRQGVTIAEGTFTWKNCILNPSLTEYQFVDITFDHGTTKKKVDLTKIDGFYSTIATN